MHQTETASCGTTASKSGSRRWLIGGATVIVALVAALYAGWGWLAATSIGATLLALAPCLAMCALGVCMARGKKP